MTDKTEGLIIEVKNELNRISGEVKQTAETALKQAKDAGDVSAEVKAKADELLTTQTKLNGKLEELEARQLELEQRGAGKREKDGPRQTLGQMVAASEEVKAFAANGARGTVKITVQNAITSLDTSAGGLIAPSRETEIVRLPRMQPRVRSLLNQGRTTSNLVQYPRQTTRTNAAAVVAEGDQKPESNYVWELADAPVRTIAHWVPIARQAMDDAAQLQTELDSELRYGLDRAEDEELLNGDGTGQHLEGLVTAATAYSAAFTLTNATNIDTLRLAILQAELADYPVDGMVLNPTDWARIELTKDSTGQYVFANVLQLAGPTLWGRPVVSTSAMDVDTFLVGAFQAAATIYDRMDTEVLISSEDRDNFIKNMLTARAEKRLAIAIKRAAALITGDFGNVS